MEEKKSSDDALIEIRAFRKQFERIMYREDSSIAWHEASMAEMQRANEHREYVRPLVLREVEALERIATALESLKK